MISTSQLHVFCKICLCLINVIEKQEVIYVNPYIYVIEDAGTIMHIYSLLEKNTDLILPFAKNKDIEAELSFSKIIMLT